MDRSSRHVETSDRKTSLDGHRRTDHDREFHKEGALFSHDPRKPSPRRILQQAAVESLDDNVQIQNLHDDLASMPAGMPGGLSRQSTEHQLQKDMAGLSFDSRSNAIEKTKRKAKGEPLHPGPKSESPPPQKLIKTSPTLAGRFAQDAGIKSRSSLPSLKKASHLTSPHQRQQSWPMRVHSTNLSRNVAGVQNQGSPTASNRLPKQPSQTNLKRTESLTRQNSAFLSSQSSRKNSVQSEASLIDAPHTSIVLQPDSRPMPEGQLAAEIKAIYSGLVMIEAKCINVVNAENVRLREIKEGKRPPDPPVENGESNWPALISLHRALLQEHHDFFLASQHPASSPQLKNLANKYSMPARMWKHGIHSFLELLRHSLPGSMEFMQAFIILAYQMIALLYETVDSFKDTWIECLGDLARYRMAIEDEDPRDRDIYTVVSRSWYNKASRRNVNIGRLYHHQAILARTQPLKQLSLYARSLAAVYPFTSARESIMTLFEPILARMHLPGSNTASIDSRFIRIQAMRFTRRNMEKYYQLTFDQFLEQLNDSIIQASHHWKLIGEWMAIILIASLLMWGEPKAPMHGIFVRKETEATERKLFGMGGQSAFERDFQEHMGLSSDCMTRLAPEWRLLVSMLEIILKKRRDDESCLPFIHVIVSFVWGLSSVQFGYLYLVHDFPFKELCVFLNHLETEKRPADPKAEPVENLTLHEDRVMQGQAFASKLFPQTANTDVDGEEDVEELVHWEQPATTRLRKDRILQLSRDIAAKGTPDLMRERSWITYNQYSRRFDVAGPIPRHAAPLPERKQSDFGEVKIAGEDHQMVNSDVI